MERCKHTSIGFLTVLLSLLLLCSCHTQRQVALETKTETRYVDSITYRDSIIYIPVEVHDKMTWIYDTLRMSTSLAEANCWVDSIWLRGEIHNKQGVQHKYITKTEYIVKDSIVYKEKPVPVEVEVVKTKNASWWVWLWAISVSCGLVAMIVKKLS